MSRVRPCPIVSNSRNAVSDAVAHRFRIFLVRPAMSNPRLAAIARSTSHVRHCMRAHRYQLRPSQMKALERYRDTCELEHQCPLRRSAAEHLILSKRRPNLRASSYRIPAMRETILPRYTDVLQGPPMPVR